MRPHHGPSWLLAATLAAGLGAQWTQASATSPPGLRQGAAMAYDPVRNRTILFGGDGSDSSTWGWDGSSWRVLAPTGPSPRADLAMAGDGAGTILLFGGLVGGWNANGETWRWQASAWTAVPGTGPSPRFRHAMAYDLLRHRYVLYGGDTGSMSLGDTWEFDGTVWRQIVVSGPGPRAFHAMAWDATRQAVLLFGGNYAGDTWEWRGSVWTRLAVPGPPGRSAHAMASLANGVVLFGGSSTSSPYLNDTWLWDGSTWIEYPPALRPSGRDRAALAPSPGGTLLYGGGTALQPLQDTWLLPSALPTVPAGAAGVEGNASFALGDTPRRRIQTLVAAAAFAPGQRVGLLRGLRLRRDAGPTLFLGRTFDLRAAVGPAGRTPKTMATNMLANWSGTPTLVHQSATALPDAGPVQPGPAPFLIALPFARPFLWNGQDLTWELEVAGASLLAPYDVDAEALPYPIGVVAAFGQSCAGSRGLPVLVPPDPRRLVPGGAIDIAVGNALPGAIAFDFLGDSDAQWFGIPLPFQWPQTNCFVYLNWVLSRSTVVLGDGTAQVTHPIPPDPALAGRRVFSQWGVYEGAQAFPPLALTSAVRLTIGADPPVHWDTVSNADGSFTGVKASDRYVTPVLQLELN